MNTIRITTSQNIELEYELASLGERIAGFIIDMIIIIAYNVLVFEIVLNKMSDNWIIIIFMFPVIFYHLLSEVFMNGQSVGKKVMNMKVISLEGGQPGFGQYMIRWVFWLIDFPVTFCQGAFICVAVTERKQRIGDLVAGTAIIKTISRTAFQQTLYTPVSQENYIVSYPEVINLTDSDMQLVREVILSVKQTGNLILANRAADKIKQILQIQSSIEPIQFLQVLLADYNYLTSKG